MKVYRAGHLPFYVGLGKETYYEAAFAFLFDLRFYPSQAFFFFCSSTFSSSFIYEYVCVCACVMSAARFRLYAPIMYARR